MDVVEFGQKYPSCRPKFIKGGKVWTGVPGRHTYVWRVIPHKKYLQNREFFEDLRKLLEGNYVAIYTFSSGSFPPAIFFSDSQRALQKGIPEGARETNIDEVIDIVERW